MVKTIQIGHEHGVQVYASLLPACKDYPAGLGWADFSVSVAGIPVWAGPESGHVRWTLVDLLSGLARIWPWLLLEDGYPLPIPADNPDHLCNKLEQRWQDLPESVALAEEEQVYDFRQRHDLSMLMRGISLPPLWLIREGNDCVIWSPQLEQEVRQSHSEVMRTLEILGEKLCTLLQTSRNPRTTAAIENWSKRNKAVKQGYLQITSGMELDELIEIAGSVKDCEQLAHFFELENSLSEQGIAPNELLMAARMTDGIIPLKEQRKLLLELKKIIAVDIAPLEQVSAIIPQLNEEQQPFEQGYQLANWLRNHLGLAPDEAVEPRDIISDWQIPLENMRLEASIDAVAVWGQKRGPAILINKSERSRASTHNGLRTTLAHEICHLLVDRQRAFPVVEVMGGKVSRRAEQRANAFAAELLLPREQATVICEKYSGDLLEAASYLEQHFKVSRELVCNQIVNSHYGNHLQTTQQRKLANWRLEHAAKFAHGETQ